MSISSPDISIIIATKNRAESLQETLAGLATQETGGIFTYEVLVADNGSTDATRQIVAELAKTYPVPLRYVYEGRAGKSYALNTGMREARGAIFAFSDDDILRLTSWLNALWTCFIEEKADAVTGRMFPSWRGDRPSWLSDDVARRISGIGCLDHGDVRRQGGYRWIGGNFAIRRNIYEQLGGFRTHLVCGEDTEYFYRCARRRLRIVYEPAVLAYHKIGGERLTPAYFRWRHHRNGYYHALLLPWRKYHLLTITPIEWYQEASKWVWRWLREVCAGHPWEERFICELRLRDRWSQWTHRLQLWPRWALTVVTGRDFMHNASSKA
jgi:glycosyltransferase involved in cell wall biosynthesis